MTIKRKEDRITQVQGTCDRHVKTMQMLGGNEHLYNEELMVELMLPKDFMTVVTAKPGDEVKSEDGKFTLFPTRAQNWCGLKLQFAKELIVNRITFKRRFNFKPKPEGKTEEEWKELIESV